MSHATSVGSPPSPRARSCATVIVTTVWARDDVAFMLVLATVRLRVPRLIRASISAYDCAAHRFAPSTKVPFGVARSLSSAAAAPGARRSRSF